MEERRDYAVLRFVDQNGWSYMVNDYAKGCFFDGVYQTGDPGGKRNSI